MSFEIREVAAFMIQSILKIKHSKTIDNVESQHIGLCLVKQTLPTYKARWGL